MQIEILDTTLREGEQTSGVSFSTSEKLNITRLVLCELNVPRIEIASARVSSGEFESVKSVCDWARATNNINKIEILGFIDNGLSINWVKGVGGRVINFLAKGSKKHCELQLGKSLEEHYNDLRIEVSNLDAELKLISESSDNPIIVVSNDVFKFLEKYGFTVISLEENNNLTDKTVVDVKTMIQNGTINYIFTLDNEETNNTITRLQKQTGVQLQTFHSISNLTEQQRNEKKDYVTLMYENLELLKNELYD